MLGINFSVSHLCDQLLHRPNIFGNRRQWGRCVVAAMGLIFVALAGLESVQAASVSSTAHAILPVAATQHSNDPGKPANLSKPEIQALIKTLDDPAKRAEFIAQLRTLTLVEKMAETQEFQALPSLAQDISQSLVDGAIQFAQNLRDFGQEIWHFRQNWARYENYFLQFSMEDEIAPIILYRLSVLGFMFVMGMLVGGIARYLADYPWRRIFLRLLWWRKKPVTAYRSLANKSVLPSLREEIFSAVGFFLGYSLAGIWFDLDPAGHTAAIALFGAAMAVRGLVILLHGVLSPDFLQTVLGIKPSPRRIVKINRWVHYFIAVLVYGILGIGVLKLVDVPVVLRLIVIRLIGLALLLLAYRALWQLHHFGRRHQQQVIARLSQMGEQMGVHMGEALGWTNLPFLNPHPHEASTQQSAVRGEKPQSDASDFESGEAPQTFFSPDSAKKTIFSRLIYVLQQFWWLVAGIYLTILYLGWAFEFHGAVIVFLKRSGVTLLVVWGAHWVLRAVDYYFGRSGILTIFPQDKAVKSRFLHRLQRYLPLIRLLLRSALVSSGFLLAMHLWNTGIINWLLTGSRWAILTQFFSILLIIGVTILLWEFISAWIEQSLREHEKKFNYGEQPKRARTILPLVRNALLVVLAIGGGVFVLGELGVHSNTILAGAGFISIGLGFGAQTIIRDIITGLFIVMEDTISIGELIEVDNVRGHVEAITLRNVRLRDKDGALYTIPFNRVNAVANFSRDFSISHIVITVSRRNDAQKIFDILLEIDRELRATAPFDKLILEPLNIEGVENFSEKGVTIQAAQKTLPTRQYDVYRAFHFRLMAALEKHKIALPEQYIVVKQA